MFYFHECVFDHENDNEMMMEALHGVVMMREMVYGNTMTCGSPEKDCWL